MCVRARVCARVCVVYPFIMPLFLILPSLSPASLIHTFFSLFIQIFTLLGIPMSYSGKPLFKMEDLIEKRYEAIQYIFQLCYKVIQHSQCNYRKNQVKGRQKL